MHAHSHLRLTLLALAGIALALPSGARAQDADFKCRQTIVKQYATYVKKATKIFQKCNDNFVKDGLGNLAPGGTDTPGCDPKQKLNVAEKKLKQKVSKACDDKGILPADIGWQATCPEFEGVGGFCLPPFPTNTGPDLASCLSVCNGRKAIRQAMDLYYGDLAAAGADKALIKCQRAVGKEATKFFTTKQKVLGNCRKAVDKGKGTLPCPNPGDGKAGEKIAKAESKKVAKICKACGTESLDGLTCVAGGFTPAQIGFPALCPSVTVPFGGPACGGAITSLSDLVRCVDCVTEFKVDCLDALSRPDQVAYPPECETPLATPTPTSTPTPTLTATPTPTETAAPMPTATRTAQPCGGLSDGMCSFGTCPDDDICVWFPGGPCGCLDPILLAVYGCQGAGPCTSGLICQDEFEECQTNCTCVPQPTPTATPGAPCPVALQLDGVEAGNDIDLGLTGIEHDNSGPYLDRLTLSRTSCVGGSTPCGECTFAGPIANAGGPAFDSQRCSCDTSVSCTGDGDCPGSCACRFFLGPPLPVGNGGVGFCLTSEITGPVTATSDVEAGTFDGTIPVETNIVLGATAGDPCPRCVGGLCDSGPNVGTACTVQGHSTPFADDTSLDCPAGTPIVAPLTYVLPLSTDVQTSTISAASPACSAVGFTSVGCHCDTCRTAAAEPCATDADCPSTTTCGGLRCIGGPFDGAPCTLPSECSGFSCAVLGEPTRPHSCVGSACTPNTPPDFDSMDEGVCTMPLDGHCSPSEPWRPCASPLDCSGGDSCVSAPRECFTTEGSLGDDVTAAGAADPPTGGVGSPILGSLTCVPPTSAGAVNASFGLPGLMRVTTPTTATYF